MVGIIDKAVEDAVAQVEAKFNQKHTEIMTEFAAVKKGIKALQDQIAQAVIDLKRQNPQK